MEIKQIKELVTLMDKAGLKTIRIKDKDKEIELVKHDVHAPQQAPVFHAHPTHPEVHSHIHPPHRPNAEPAPQAVDGKFITAPLVGTIYHSPSPEDASFVKVGDKVDENTVVCIIEAMKVMNEVKAGVSGTVAEILVKNAHPVEFGAKLIRIV